ncbi:pyruvate:ferredoxin (flavodoxin) oxidoreductase [Seleniivibrio woodruffii]|uniref:Pyruvate-ferredoxin/flavodoxin oxidoreductase n=1 Tax=Seleniivibrio woodruffii TaxID=1078050 RepID=A0A4R1K8G3_9BACT|nr:pyruvate:ferredoxin (flavodoxin) oxidoreductase [Seleniivibrio woodruffii]TCK60605.1 pyruvate-ferredoxin/flavodoxin oxidoreductase [Seleniivibrio woodruffii]TVZ36234.1 pyruvate-ferredoxin/flavodoxin oxidoreductase [Seleniivibrio woodruffii]
MAENRKVIIDGNTAAAHVAHATNEVIAIYPITPSSVMGEISDEKSAVGETNIWGSVPKVVELQSEGGASGAVHGALSAGALTTTFTASQGLLLMIPNMYKIAGELTPTVFHVSARALATHALSIFGDHSDVLACRQTGWAMLASNNPQEVMDFALISQAAALEGRVPVLHFFDGFRTSHELRTTIELTKEEMKEMICDDLVIAHRKRALNPDTPTIKGTSQNPDVFFQAKETVNKFYQAFPAIVQSQMDKFAKMTGRSYKLVDYFGAPDAEKVLVIMGSGADVAEEAIEYMNACGEKVGLVKIRLYRPFPLDQFIAALPKTVKKIAVLDRTKEPGSIGEPMYLDVRTAIGEAMQKKMFSFDGYPIIVGGRYGLGSKEFTPAMVKAVFDNLDANEPLNGFTVGIMDDVTGLSLNYDENWLTPQDDVFNAMFFGLGSDGTVGANKNSAKIIGDLTDNTVQAYFVYDSKKAGSMTTSHLRFGKRNIKSSYLVQKADFVACHNFSFLDKYDMLKYLKPGGTFLLNSQYSADEIWAHIPAVVQKQIVAKQAKVYTINAVDLAEKIGLGSRYNVILQTAFFKISNIVDFDTVIGAIKDANKKTYGRYGEKVVKMNNDSVDAGSTGLQEVKYPGQGGAVSGEAIEFPLINNCITDPSATDFVKDTTSMLVAMRGDEVKVSQLPNDGTFPTGTAKFEKRNIAINIPEWDSELCIQCAICSFVCPHAAIRTSVYPASELSKAPASFKSMDAKGKEFDGMKFTVQVAPEDCTGCGACVYNCPAKSKTNPEHKAINMVNQLTIRDQEIKNFDFFLTLPELPNEKYNKATLKGSQLAPHMFEFSGACAGCGETPYIKLLAQLFGDRALIANATGCSSIYGGNLPTTPYTTRCDGKGPAWSNSLFEDNAEFGFGMRLTVDKFNSMALELLDRLADKLDAALVAEIKTAEQKDQLQIEAQRARVEKLKAALAGVSDSDAKNLISIADYLVKKSVWVVGGDGWAYDIGYGGLDHVLASGENINVLVLDTEVYSNTGGQASKSTPIGAQAKFAFSGKAAEKKDLSMICMTYGHIYVARVALANPAQVIKAFVEAEAHDGPSIIIAYSHCIAHGINMTEGVEAQKKAVASGYWPLFRFNPELREQGKNPLTIDSKEPTMSLKDFMATENRFRVVQKMFPDKADAIVKFADMKSRQRLKLYQELAKVDCSIEEK